MGTLLLLSFAIQLTQLSAGEMDAFYRTSGFARRAYRGTDGRSMPYRLFIPARYDETQKYPLVLWLHGIGGMGLDNQSQLMGDQVDGVSVWTKTQNQREHPAFIVAPQSGSRWDDTGNTNVSSLLVLPPRAELSEQLRQVINIIESLQSEFSIDSKRIYVVGQSIGGFGAWNLITKRPDYFAAAIIVSGGGDPTLAADARNTPVWAFQGATDSVFLESNRG